MAKRRDDLEPPGQSIGTVRTLDDFLKLMATGYQYDCSEAARHQEALAGLTAAELEALAREFDALRKACSPRVRGFYASTIDPVVERWMVLAPLAALDYALDQEHVRAGDVRKGAVEALTMAVLSAPEDPGLLRTVAKLMHIENAGVCGAYLKTLENLPAEEALAKIFAFNVRSENDESSYATGGHPERWIAADPEAAMAWALAQPPSRPRRYLLYAMAKAWGTQDAAAARDYLHSIPLSVIPSGEVRSIMESCIRSAAPGDSP